MQQRQLPSMILRVYTTSLKITLALALPTLHPLQVLMAVNSPRAESTSDDSVCCTKGGTDRSMKQALTSRRGGRSSVYT